MASPGARRPVLCGGRRQERTLCRAPARGVSLPALRRLPVPIPADQLRGLIDRAEAPMAKLVVALIAIHALGKKGTSQLRLADLDLPSGRLFVPRATWRHPSYLAQLTTRHAYALLQQRTRP